jgi:hypothetical protein
MKNKQKRLEDALYYIGYCIKEGYGNFEDIDIKSMTDEEIIKMAEDAQDRAENYYDQMKEEGLCE